MKKAKITYWISTAVIALMMMYSAYAYLTDPMLLQAFTHLGIPTYLRVELAIAKIIGALLLIAPVPAKVKEWVYAGFGIVFVSAFIAHSYVGDPVSVRLMPLFFFALMIVSYVSYHSSRMPSLLLNSSR